MARPQIQTRIDEEKKQRITEWRKAQGIETESEAARQLITRGLDYETGEIPVSEGPGGSLLNRLASLRVMLAAVALLTVSVIMWTGAAVGLNTGAYLPAVLLFMLGGVTQVAASLVAGASVLARLTLASTPGADTPEVATDV